MITYRFVWPLEKASPEQSVNFEWLKYAYRNLPGNLPGAAAPVPKTERVRPEGQADHQSLK